MSSPNQPQSAPASGPAVDTRQGRGSKDKSGGGAISGALKKITSKLAWVMAGIIFAGIFFWGVAEIALNGPEPSVPFAGLTGHFSFDRFLLLGGILCLIPPTIVYLFESKKRDAIDNNIPHLIRDIADAGRSGMTLTRAIEISAERDYGPLTKEIKKLIAKISFRVPLERALQFFADRTGTMLSRRTAMLVSEANKSGGDIQESMESIAKHIQEIQYLERKRRATLRPFIGVMYISFAVFLVTVYLLISSFFKQLANTTFGGSSAIGGVGFNFISLPLPKITAVFLYMAMIEALFAGLVGGKMATGYLKDGLKHAILLMLICFVTFVFFV